jgi:dUTP pyrophosphatase|tara:strand:- start:230 stop:865 length:636 start_codon:yes stop_codon:yes gene_type:complete
MDNKEMKNVEKTMKATLEQLENFSKSLSDSEAGNDDNVIFKDMGLDLESLSKMQDEAFADMSNTIDILYLNKSKLEDPKYNHKEDSGFDIRANIDDDITISSLERVLVPTGLHFQIHEDYELQIRPRSGLAAKHGISVLNTPGTVDSNYRGEIKIILVNLSKEDYTIKRGDRVAQGVVSYVLKQKWGKLKKVKTLNTTSRNDGAFGSTGKN